MIKDEEGIDHHLENGDAVFILHNP